MSRNRSGDYERRVLFEMRLVGTAFAFVICWYSRCHLAAAVHTLFEFLGRLLNPDVHLREAERVKAKRTQLIESTHVDQAEPHRLERRDRAELVAWSPSPWPRAVVFGRLPLLSRDPFCRNVLKEVTKVNMRRENGQDIPRTPSRAALDSGAADPSRISSTTAKDTSESQKFSISSSTVRERPYLSSADSNGTTTG